MATFLVVNHDPDRLSFTRRLLEDDGHRVWTSDNGAEAFRLAVDDQPDAVLVALDLPGIAGEQLAEMLRADESTTHIPVAILTAAVSARERQDVVEAGFVQISEAADPQTFISEVNALLGS